MRSSKVNFIQVESKMKKTKSNQPRQIYLNRVKCDCVAQKHQLINNCLGCGKVVCAQEGQGPCLYCAKVVTRPDTTLIINEGDQTLFPSLNKQQLKQVSQERSKAILHTNKLVQRDRSDNLTQNIIDEQMDYYDVSQNQWLDEDARQKALDRILQKSSFVEKQQFKTKVELNPLTGQFERVEWSYDEDAFKKEGRDFISQLEKKDFNERMRRTKESHIDDRMLKNQKIKELCEDLLKKQRAVPEELLKKKAEVERKSAASNLIIEDEETSPELGKKAEK